MKLNLGCGQKIKKGWINLDFIKGHGIDIIHNLNKFPYPFKENTFDYVYVNMVLEELDFYEETIMELHRISKKNAV
ncbi:MAG: methyltransferase domain-containing protein [Candidatus Woesearchaeota archaeon]